MTTADRPRRKPDYRIEQMDGELLLFHPATNQVMYCNETAAMIWALCDGERTAAEMAELLTSAYPESTAEITRDLEETLARFTAQGAVEYV
jgi:hypothetical protein